MQSYHEQRENWLRQKIVEIFPTIAEISQEYVTKLSNIVWNAGYVTPNGLVISTENGIEFDFYLGRRGVYKSLDDVDHPTFWGDDDVFNQYEIYGESKC